jgi:hypothetical protein
MVTQIKGRLMREPNVRSFARVLVWCGACMRPGTETITFRVNTNYVSTTPCMHALGAEAYYYDRSLRFFYPSLQSTFSLARSPSFHW